MSEPPLSAGDLGDAGAHPSGLERDVRHLAEVIGERNVFRRGSLQRAGAFLEAELEAAGYEPRLQRFRAQGVECRNVEVEVPGALRRNEIVVVGAHYDTVPGCPGANDNGSGVAALLSLARAFHGTRPRRTLRLVFFANEEPPFFMSGEMGSLVYATRCASRGERVRGMLSLETIGCYDDRPGSQRYPAGFLRPFYPDVGDFVGFVSNLRSWRLLRTCLRAYRRASGVPARGAALPAIVPGVGWSDHQAFWAHGFPALMVTDTAPFRYPHYHTPEDTAEKLDYRTLAEVVGGLEAVVARLARL